MEPSPRPIYLSPRIILTPQGMLSCSPQCTSVLSFICFSHRGTIKRSLLLNWVWCNLFFKERVEYPKNCHKSSLRGLNPSSDQYCTVIFLATWCGMRMMTILFVFAWVLTRRGTQTRRCQGDCGCEQKYKWHRLLAYNPDNDCAGIFMDWFLFPSCCVCRCDPLRRWSPSRLCHECHMCICATFRVIVLLPLFPTYCTRAWQRERLEKKGNEIIGSLLENLSCVHVSVTNDSRSEVSCLVSRNVPNRCSSEWMKTDKVKQLRIFFIINTSTRTYIWRMLLREEREPSVHSVSRIVFITV